MGKLSPGERAINWVKALAILVTVLTSLLGYTNRDLIAGWVGGDGDVPSEDGFNQQVITSFAVQKARILALEALVEEHRAFARSKDIGNYNALNKRLEKMEELVQ